MVSSLPCVLIGLPGVGKSSVGRAVANELGRPFVDLDTSIEKAAGCPIPQIFSGQGEPAFRKLETESLIEALGQRPVPVIAGGGGLVVTEANRNLLSQADVVWLDAPNEVLTRRIPANGARPLLAGDQNARLRRLRHERLPHYLACADHVIVDDGSLTIRELVARVVARSRAELGTDDIMVETVHIGEGRSYPVLVGPGAIGCLDSVLPVGVHRVAVITQDGIGIEVDTGVEHQVFTVEDGEGAKRLEVVGDLASRFARWGLTRADAVVSVGGGVVSDLAGYVASSYHRGIPVVHVSTTLLGQIDAAIGGKCGVNLPEGKNLLGAFKQPAAVICDTNTLSTLPVAEFRSGMGELAKYHFIGDGFISDGCIGDGRLDLLPLAERVAACVRIKADVVADDEHETGRRAILNYGHTLAHALEAATGYRIRHGEAVAVGLLYAAEVGLRLGRIDEARVAEHRRVIDAYGLDPTMEDSIDGHEIVDLFGRDKKAIDGVTFVLDGPDGLEAVLVEDESLLRSALETVQNATRAQP
ncbi:MAG: bifunctional shikimate kinase/3-dehydroquinate synthase [Actinomycetia bacterium]|nr:bifunctional shikimate kinase/3-dehydroquinate synthase [Actinomycetes bacterium]